MKDNLEHICVDNGPSDWFFDADEKKFVRIYENTKDFGGAISGEQLPNPHILWQTRCDHFGVPQGTEFATEFGGVTLKSSVRLKPTPAVFAMWERWQKEAA